MSTEEEFGLWLEMPNRPMTLEAFMEAMAWVIYPGESDEAEEDRALYEFGLREGGMRRAVEDGQIVPKNRMTRLRETVLQGAQLWRCVVFPGDVRQFLAEQGIGLKVVAEAVPEAAEPRNSSPAPQAQEPSEPAPVQAVVVPLWGLKSRDQMQRRNDLRDALYEFLRRADKTKPLPTAGQVIEAWSHDEPGGIMVHPASVEYFAGTRKRQCSVADLKDRIKNMTTLPN